MSKKFARIQNGIVAEPPVALDEAPGPAPEWFWIEVPEAQADQVKEFWTYADGAFAAPPPPPVIDETRYVPLATIRERLQASGSWPSFAAAIDGLPAEQRWHLLTLREGVAPDDPDAVRLLTAIGADPAVVLADPDREPASGGSEDGDPTDAPADTPSDPPADTPPDAPADAPSEAPSDAPADPPADPPADAPTEAPTSTSQPSPDTATETTPEVNNSNDPAAGSKADPEAEGATTPAPDADVAP